MNFIQRIYNFFTQVYLKNKLYLLASIIGLITFLYLFFTNPFIPPVYLCDFTEQAADSPYLVQWDTGYGFSNIQSRAIKHTAPKPILRKYPNSIDYIEFNRNARGTILFSFDDSGTLCKLHVNKFITKPNHYSPNPLVFSITPNAVNSISLSINGKVDTYNLKGFGRGNVYVIISDSGDGKVNFGISTRTTNIYYFRYLPLNLSAVRVSSSLPSNNPYTLLISGNIYKIVKGSHRNGWDYYAVDLSWFGEANVYYTVAAAVAALIVALFIIALFKLNKFYTSITFAEETSTTRLKIFIVLSAIFIANYALLLYVYYPGTSYWDFPYELVTSLKLTHWLSLYHVLFYILLHVTIGFVGNFIVQILFTTYLVSLSAVTWVDFGLNKKYSVVLALAIGLSPVVSSYTIYFKRDILGGLFCALALVLTLIALKKDRKVFIASYIFAILATITRIDYIVYLFAVMFLDIIHSHYKIKAIMRSIILLIAVVVVFNNIIPRLLINKFDKIDAMYRVVALVPFINYANSKNALNESDKKIYSRYFKNLNTNYNMFHDMRHDFYESGPFIKLWLKTAFNYPEVFFQFYLSQLKMAFDNKYGEALPSNRRRSPRSFDYALIQPREGTFPYRYIKSIITDGSLWSFLPSLTILFLSIFAFKRTPITSIFGFVCVLRFFAIMPVSPGFRFFYVYDIYLIGLLALGTFPIEWRMSRSKAGPKIAQGVASSS